jgi:exosortase H (IPTLxxWG-CTERM-specific)
MSPAARSFWLFIAFATVGFALLVIPYVDREFVAVFVRVIATISGSLIDFFGGSVVVNGAALQAPTANFAILVDNGCSGLEATILVIAATMAYPTTIRLRLLGALACSLAILGVNLIRVISLFYLGQYSREWFDWAHLYAWDVLIMIDGLIAYALWIRFVGAREAMA